MRAALLWHFGVTIKQNELWGSLIAKVTTEWVTHKAKIQWAKNASDPSHDRAGKHAVSLCRSEQYSNIQLYSSF